MSGFSETTVRVRYAETDQMGVVYHSNYFIYFEVGRVELLRQSGVRYKEMESSDDCFIVVVECSCRFRKPAHYDDVLRVRTRVASATTRMCRMEYELLNDSTGDLLATAETAHVFCDRQGRPRSLPHQYRPIFNIRETQNAKPAK